MKDTWAFGLTFSTFHLFFGLGIALVQAPSFMPGSCPLFSCVCGLLGWWSCHATTLLLLYHYLSFISLLPMGLRADAPASPLSTSFLLSGFILTTFLPCQPISVLGHPRLAHFSLWASSAHLLILYIFYSHGFLLNHLGFLGPTTTSLPLITFQAYWPLSQPYEFTNSYLGLPPIYLFFTSYYSHRFTTSFLRHSRSIYFFFTSFYFCMPADNYFYHSGLLGFTLLIFSSYFLYIVRLLLPLGLLSKVGISKDTTSFTS